MSARAIVIIVIIATAAGLLAAAIYYRPLLALCRRLLELLRQQLTRAREAVRKRFRKSGTEPEEEPEALPAEDVALPVRTGWSVLLTVLYVLLSLVLAYITFRISIVHLAEWFEQSLGLPAGADKPLAFALDMAIILMALAILQNGFRGKGNPQATFIMWVIQGVSVMGNMLAAPDRWEARFVAALPPALFQVVFHIGLRQLKGAVRRAFARTVAAAQARAALAQQQQEAAFIQHETELDVARLQAAAAADQRAAAEAAAKAAMDQRQAAELEAVAAATAANGNGAGSRLAPAESKARALALWEEKAAEGREPTDHELMQATSLGERRCRDLRKEFRQTSGTTAGTAGSMTGTVPDVPDFQDADARAGAR